MVTAVSLPGFIKLVDVYSSWFTSSIYRINNGKFPGDKSRGRKPDKVIANGIASLRVQREKNKNIN